METLLLVPLDLNRCDAKLLIALLPNYRTFITYRNDYVVALAPYAHFAINSLFCDHTNHLYSPMQGGNQSDLPSSGILPGTTYAQQHFAQNHELQEQLSKFWAEMRDEVDNVGTDPAEFKSQQLPLARIKKVRTRR
jgi:hypothetical protein